MATFFFRAVAPDGKLRTGSLTAESDRIVARELRKQGLTPVYVGVEQKKPFELKLPAFAPFNCNVPVLVFVSVVEPLSVPDTVRVVEGAVSKVPPPAPRLTARSLVPAAPLNKPKVAVVASVAPARFSAAPVPAAPSWSLALTLNTPLLTVVAPE